MKDHLASLGLMFCQHVESLSHFYFLDQDYRYKSVATEIPYNAGLTPVRTAEERTRDSCMQGNDSAAAQRCRTMLIIAITIIV